MSDYSAGAPLWSRFVDSAKSASPRPVTPSWVVPDGQERLPPPEEAREGCPLPFDWDRRRYAALDVETTGLDAWRDRIVEIGIVLFSYDREGALAIENEWGTLVNPGSPIPASATNIHGITDFDVFASPSFGEIAGQVADMLRGRVMVAHNAPFDAGFVAQEFARLRQPSPLAETADSLALLRLAVPNLLSYNLGKAAFVLGVDAGNSHRALDDARTCMRLFNLSARALANACP